MFKVQEFYCEDTPVDEDIREAIIYANTHNCAVKVVAWMYRPNCFGGLTPVYIFPNEDFNTVKERFIYFSEVSDDEPV